MGHRNSLLKYTNGQVQLHEFSLEEIPSEFSDMRKDKYGNYWLSTESSGIVRWDGEENICFVNTRNSDILSNECYDLEMINGDELWINHRSGLSKMKVDSIFTLPKINNSDEFLYTLYPNPSSGQITLTNPNLRERQVDIYSWRGVLLSSQRSLDVEWSTTLEAGVYFIRIREGESETVEKVVVME